MSEHGHIWMELPPLPYYLVIGLSTFSPGEMHPSRRSLGIFDLLWVVKGTFTSVRTIKSGRLRRVKRYYCCQTATIILSKPVKQRPFSIGFISTFMVSGSKRPIGSGDCLSRSS